MPVVVICSLVRDGMDYLPSFRRQLESLRLEPGSSWRLCILEGDSADDSWKFLCEWAAADPRVIAAQEHVGEASDKSDRAARWARVGNACLDLVAQAGPHTHVLWLEADLCFPPELLQRLLSREVDVVAPVVFLGGLFYDIWGFRDLDGKRWTNEAPYHPDYQPMALMEMGSVGSCVLFRREVLDAGIRFRGDLDHGLLVGVCSDARRAGFRVWADTSTAILHPVAAWEAQKWAAGELVLVDRSGREERLTPAEARALGMMASAGALDPSTFLRGNGLFWKKMFRRLRTNRLAVEVFARAQPTRSYRMRIEARAPSGIAGVKAVRKQLLRGPGFDDFAPHVAGTQPPDARTRLRRLLFHCDITIALEDAP